MQTVHEFRAIDPAKRLRIGVLLSGREQFSTYYGGALARWTYEVYSRTRECMDVSVFGFPTDPETLYPLPHLTSDYSSYCDLVSKVPLLRRREDHLWLWTLRTRLRNLEIIHIHNRPQWVPILHDIGFRGAIILHLQNDHLGHWTGPMLDVLATKLDALVVCSHSLGCQFGPRSPSLAAKTHVIFNGVNTRLFRPRDDIREPKTVFFVGRFHPEKGVLQLLSAFAHVLKIHPDAKLVIGGATGFGTNTETHYVREVQALAQAIRNRGADVRFTGYINHDCELPSWFQRATLFACPSLFAEPFGLVNAEAMACATPVVGSNRGGIPEVVAETGRLIDPENVEDFASTVSTLLSQPQLCTELGRAAYNRCRDLFDWDIIARRWTQFLDALISQTRPSLSPSASGSTTRGAETLQNLLPDVNSVGK